MELVPKAVTDGPASSSYARRRSKVVAVRAVEVDTAISYDLLLGHRRALVRLSESYFVR